jgi:hypothetical protein
MAAALAMSMEENEPGPSSAEVCVLPTDIMLDEFI